MNETVQIIPLSRLALAFIPVCAVLVIIHRWSLGTRAGLVAVVRMVTQLLLVGYVLTFIFESDSAAVVLAVVSVMLATRVTIPDAASALRPESLRRQTRGDPGGPRPQSALIPMTNSLLAVGIVSFPGMMTGQILSGVEPLIAVRYQILVMCMIFGSAGLESSPFLVETLHGP